ncbi:hypothetical protein C8046_02190 [Serinibacter arcticus]|uniref:Division initiation protein n=1 Tax=Serinibacter arcticus TaxID=1655435 RepID=A0A2U1ZRS7_9MICO|nr:DUF881 domain-containing protein [Serinibacter arcticus]PWD49695.1 hypothetical protein C8046_02190 [Serinibacter arcticus]
MGDDDARTPGAARHRHAHAAPAPTAPDTGADPAADAAPTAAVTGATTARPAASATGSGWGTRSHLLVALLCALLGFAIVVQVRQTNSDELASLRQDDLVRLLDEITLRNDQLETEQAQLTIDRNDLSSGADAQVVAERNAEVQGILAGTIAVEGPGIDLVVREQGRVVPASAWVNLVEELRNAGAEAIEVDGVRVGASTWFADRDGGVVVDGVELTSPVSVRAIGDPQVLEVALGIPGGALATLRTNDAVPQVEARDSLEILSVRDLTAPEVASPAPEQTSSSG